MWAEQRGVSRAGQWAVYLDANWADAREWSWDD